MNHTLSDMYFGKVDVYVRNLRANGFWWENFGILCGRVSYASTGAVEHKNSQHMPIAQGGAFALCPTADGGSTHSTPEVIWNQWLQVANNRNCWQHKMGEGTHS